MGKPYRKAVEFLILETIVLAIATAYVFGLMNGIQSQQKIIEEILEDLPYYIIVESGAYTHPLWHPLLGIASITAASWIAISIMYLSERKREQRLKKKCNDEPFIEY